MEKPEDYRPIALFNLSYKIFAKMIQVKLCKGFGEHLDSQQYGFRKAKSTSQPLYIYIYIHNNFRNTRGSRARNVHTLIRLGKGI